MSDLPSPEALVEMKERCARAKHRSFRDAGAFDRYFFDCAIRDLPAALDLIGELLDEIDDLQGDPPKWHKYTTPAWRSVAAELRKGRT